MTTPTLLQPDRELKAKHRAVWAAGDYAAVAREVIPSLGPELVRVSGVRAGEAVLDLAAGAGNVAIPAAQAGARVTAVDLTPELLEAGRARAELLGLDIDWRAADAEALPFADAEFDAVLSCVGVMFAPHHEQAAAELVRVARPGGRIGLTCWTPEGFVGRLLATMKPYVPPPPPGARPAPLWGREEYLRGLLGDGVTDVRVQRRMHPVGMFGTGAAFARYFGALYGPITAARRGLVADPERAAALDRDLAELAEAALADGQMGWEYLLVTAVRR